MPTGAVYVGRGTPWGNPSVVGADAATRGDAVAAYRTWLADPERAPLRERIRTELAGADLACWCPPADACHATVLLAIANPAGE